MLRAFFTPMPAQEKTVRLTPQIERFCREYVVDHNGKQAAIRAGYSKNSAVVQASRLLSADNVRSLVAANEAEINAKLDAARVLSKERILEELRRVTVFNIKDLVKPGGEMMSLEEMPEELAAAIDSIEWEDVCRLDAQGNRVYVRVVKKYWFTKKLGAIVAAARVKGMLKDPLDDLVNPLTELMERISGNGSGLPYRQ